MPVAVAKGCKALGRPPLRVAVQHEASVGTPSHVAVEALSFDGRQPDLGQEPPADAARPAIDRVVAPTSKQKPERA